MRKSLFISFFLLFSALILRGQIDLAKDTTYSVTLSGYVETYYNYCLNDPKGQIVQPYFYNYARRNEFDINMALLRFSYADSNYRGSIGLMCGNYAQYNLAAEPQLLQNLYEGYVGFRIKKNLWLDAGVFPSHIGAESAIGKDNINLTRSLMAENSPYYESGVKVTWDRGKKWSFTGLLLNGWQNIRDNNRDKAFGWQIVYKASSKLSFNSSSFAGNEQPDTMRQQYRLFHNFHFVYTPAKKFTLIFYVDNGFQQDAGSFSIWHHWYATSLKAKISPWEKVSFGLRAEQFTDQHGVILAKITPNGFQAAGGSINIDVHPYKNVTWRTEFRYLRAYDNVFFRSGGKMGNEQLNACTALMISF